MTDRKQRGFTVIEITISLFLGLLIIGAMITSFANKSEDEHMFEARLFFLKQATESITRYRLNGGEIVNLVKSDLTNSNLTPNTPWGDSWTVAPEDANVKFTWLLTSADNPTGSCQALANVIPLNNTNIISAICGGSTLNVVMRGQ